MEGNEEREASDMEMIKVLVTNDDGIDAPGIRALVEGLSEYADVYVAAPAEEQSGKSQSITFMREVRAEERDVKGAAAAWAIDGTPADCVIWGISRLAEDGIRPDYVFSGINAGYNSGMAAYYSGTIAGAREGALNGIRSIALSTGDPEAESFGYLLGLLPRLMEMSQKISPRTILNVNAPDIESWAVRGVRIVESAPHGYGIILGFTKTDSGNYQMSGGPAPSDDRMRYDVDWNDEGYVTISPLPTTLSDPVSLMRLNEQTAAANALAVIIDPDESLAAGINKKKRRARFRTNLDKLSRCVYRMDMPVLIAEKAILPAAASSKPADPSAKLKGTSARSELASSNPEAAPAKTKGRSAKHADASSKSACAKKKQPAGMMEEVRRLLPSCETLIHNRPDLWSMPDMYKCMGIIDTDEVFIAGGETHVAVLQTALSFIENGYNVTIIEDCCASASKHDHRLAIERLKDAGCCISTYEAAVMRIAGACEKNIRESVERILKNCQQNP